MRYTRRTLKPADPIETGNRNICATDHHQPETYNPWLYGTFCRCGRILWHGNHSPLYIERDTEMRAVADEYERKATTA